MAGDVVKARERIQVLHYILGVFDSYLMLLDAYALYSLSIF